MGWCLRLKYEPAQIQVLVKMHTWQNDDPNRAKRKVRIFWIVPVVVFAIPSFVLSVTLSLMASGLADKEVCIVGFATVDATTYLTVPAGLTVTFTIGATDATGLVNCCDVVCTDWVDNGDPMFAELLGWDWTTICLSVFCCCCCCCNCCRCNCASTDWSCWDWLVDTPCPDDDACVTACARACMTVCAWLWATVVCAVATDPWWRMLPGIWGEVAWRVIWMGKGLDRDWFCCCCCNVPGDDAKRTAGLKIWWPLGVWTIWTIPPERERQTVNTRYKIIMESWGGKCGRQEKEKILLEWGGGGERRCTNHINLLWDICLIWLAGSAILVVWVPDAPWSWTVIGWVVTNWPLPAPDVYKQETKINKYKNLIIPFRSLIFPASVYVKLLKSSKHE